MFSFQGFRYFPLILLFISLICLAMVTFFAKKYTNYPKTFEEIKWVNEAPTEIRTTPEDRGGRRFDNQDKNVFTILE